MSRLNLILFMILDLFLLIKFFIKYMLKCEKYDFGIKYYLNDKLHRVDGPALEFNNGYKA